MHRKIPLPRSWNRRVKSAVLQILALSHYGFTALIARAANDRNRPTRMTAEIDRLQQALALPDQVVNSREWVRRNHGRTAAVNLGGSDHGGVRRRSTEPPHTFAPRALSPSSPRVTPGSDAIASRSFPIRRDQFG